MSAEHGWTRHGHRCCDQATGPRPSRVARCGGPAICRDCAADAAIRHSPAATSPVDAVHTVSPDKEIDQGDSMSTESNDAMSVSFADPELERLRASAKAWEDTASVYARNDLDRQADIAQLRARLSEVEAERDAARSEIAAYRSPGVPTYAALLDSHAKLLAEQDQWVVGYRELAAERDAAIAVREAWRPVVEAAIAYENRWRRYAGIQPGADSVDVRLAKAKAHQALLDATRTLDSTTPGATDGD